MESMKTTNPKFLNIEIKGFPGGSAGKESACNVGDLGENCRLFPEKPAVYGFEPTERVGMMKPLRGRNSRETGCAPHENKSPQNVL